MSERVISADEYQKFRDYLVENTGIVLGDNKHYLVSSRLNRLMEENGHVTYSQLLELIKKPGNSQLREKVIDAMTTNETMWFRDTYPFDILKTKLLPEIGKINGGSVRIWSAACSSGQEPYSISMTAQEFIAMSPGMLPQGVEIVATDISARMLAYCKLGVYDKSAMNRGLSEERKQRFFNLNDEFWEIKPEIKRRVTFKSLNLQNSYASLGKFDVIFCRNVLIYFSTEFKTDILTRMTEVLRPGGYLFLGSSETPTRYTSLYKMVRTPLGVIYQYQPD